jgi:hypothetical protein
MVAANVGEKNRTSMKKGACKFAIIGKVERTTQSEPMKPADILNADTIAAVNAYLIARAFAETMRAKVEAVEAKILAECPILDEEGQPITKGRDLWKTDDSAHSASLCADFYAEKNVRLRRLGIKPADMPDTHCPALVAEETQRQAERLLIEVSGAKFGVTPHRLLCASLAKYQEWIDLTCKMVTNLPIYKAPALG